MTQVAEDVGGSVPEVVASSSGSIRAHPRGAGGEVEVRPTEVGSWRTCRLRVGAVHG